MQLSGYHILVASNTSNITGLFFDPKGPTFNVTSETFVGPGPTWLTGHPTNPSLVFTGLTQGNNTIVALNFNDTGNGTEVGHIPSGGVEPTSLLATMDAVFVANVRMALHFTREWNAFADPWMTARLLWCCVPKSTVRLRDDHGCPSVRLAPIFP
jgi:hypothetical protein